MGNRKIFSYLKIFGLLIVVYLCIWAVGVSGQPQASAPKSLDEMMDSLRSRMDKFMEKPFFSDPSIDTLRGFDAFGRSLEEKMEKMFERMLGNDPFFKSSRKGLWGDFEANSFKYDLSEVDGKFIVTVDMPGHAKDAIQLKIKDNSIILSSERKSAIKTEEKNVYRNQISYGSFSQVIGLPKKVLEDKVTAKYENGVLTIIAPIDKSSPQYYDGRKIEIQ